MPRNGKRVFSSGRIIKAIKLPESRLLGLMLHVADSESGAIKVQFLPD